VDRRREGETPLARVGPLRTLQRHWPGRTRGDESALAHSSADVRSRASMRMRESFLIELADELTCGLPEIGATEFLPIVFPVYEHKAAHLKQTGAHAFADTVA
jgi:hypothetical protein